MKFVIPVILSLFTFCGSPPSEEENNSASLTASENSSPATDNTLTETEKADGWKLLFDGGTMQGWHTYQGAPGRWTVENGELNADSTRGPALQGKTGVMGGSMVTDADYENFHLKIDWKISEGGNSGVMILTNEDKSIAEDYHSAPEFQILDNIGYRGFGYPTTSVMRVGALYGVMPSADTSGNRPAGEWNTAEIIKKDSSLQFILNGTTTLKTTLWNDAWYKAVAASPYSKTPFAKLKKGKISLQDHGYKVWFKNIKLREL